MLCVKDNATKETHYIPLKKGIQVNDYKDAAEFLEIATESNNHNPEALETIVGYLCILSDYND